MSTKRKRSSGKKPLKVFNIGGNHNLWIPDTIIEKDIEQADIVIAPGGSDWHPFLYDCACATGTYSSPGVDLQQMKMMIKAVRLNKFIIGICRGLQGLHILSGGELIQDVTGHRSSDHIIEDIFTGEQVKVNSMHHQMVDLNSLDSDMYVLIAKSQKISTRYLGGHNTELYHLNGVLYKNDPDFNEPEVVYYPKIKGLGFQYHPEMMDNSNPASEYTNQIIKDVYHAYRKDPIDRDGHYNILSMEYRLEKFEESYLDVKPNYSNLLLPISSTLKNTAGCCEIKTKAKNEEDWRSMLKKF